MRYLVVLALLFGYLLTAEEKQAPLAPKEAQEAPRQVRCRALVTHMTRLVENCAPQDKLEPLKFMLANPRAFMVTPKQDEAFNQGKFDDEGNLKKLTAHVKKLKEPIPVLLAKLLMKVPKGELKGIDLEITVRWLATREAKPESPTPAVPSIPSAPPE